MKTIRRFAFFEGIIFLVAAVITFFLGEISIKKYGSILLYCGFGSLVIGVASGSGFKRGPMSDSWNSWRTSQKQELIDMKDLQSSGKTQLHFFLIGAIPVVVGYLLTYIFKAQ
jgi:hypothetical protein